MKALILLAFTFLLVARASAAQRAAQAHLKTSKYRVTVDEDGGRLGEIFSVRTSSGWKPTLAAAPPIRVVTPNGPASCKILSADGSEHGIVLRGDCVVGTFEQRLTATTDEDRIEVVTRLNLPVSQTVDSVEDRYDFLPPRNSVVDDHTGPLDFVWSQNIKSEAGDLIASSEFKSPVIMMQQGEQFAALLAEPSTHHVETRAFDLDVTSAAKPWMSFGAIPSEPHGHSYFRRASSVPVGALGNTIEYRYDILLSEQAPRLGYRRAVRLLWQRLGHPELLQSAAEQRNVLRPELSSFASWRKDAWTTYADQVYTGWTCGTHGCGTLASNRSVTGDWKHFSADAWFNPWFETLRTAYGWYVHGKAVGDQAMMNKAESVLTLALQAPRDQGAFSTIYLVPTETWVPSDGWAGFKDSYDSFSMSWTAYWMLRWAEDLVPQRKTEILAFVRGYGDFLLVHQKASGVIPSWFLASSLEPRVEFRDFNAETAPSALFLATLSVAAGEQRYRVAAEKAMAFISREVVPRQRWFDFETYLSCARKPFSFFDPFTAQFPQNNLAELQAPEAMLALYRATANAEYLERGSQMLDYVLLTQQVWNNPAFTPLLLGGFTTQNTDAEWSDARQAYAATVLADYYDATGNPEYLERAIAAARSTFAVAPWENWAHTGYIDGPGELTGFHWGTGSAMTTVELLQPILGDALIDASSGHGAGFDECTIDDLAINGGSITFRLSSPDLRRSFLVHFRGLKPARSYNIAWNGTQAITRTGQSLLTNGLIVPPLAGSNEALAQR